jgi:hypothetical protein
MNSLRSPNRRSCCLATVLLAAAMLALLEVSEGRVAGHRPACVIVRVGVLAPPVLEIVVVVLERRLQAVQHVGLVEGAGQAAFPAGAVVGGDEDQRIVELADAFQLGDDAADLQVDPFELRGEDLHLPHVELLLRVRQRVPCRDFVDALGQQGVRGHDPQLLLAGQDLLSRRVPPHVELALVLVDVAVGSMVRGVHRSRGPEHHERQVRLDRLVAGDPLDRPVGQVLVEVHGLAIRLGRMVVPHHRDELVHVGRHEGVGVLKALAARPAVEGTDLGDLVERGVVPLPECVVDVARFLQVVRHRLRGRRHHGVVSREAHGGQRMAAEADGVRASR